MKAIQFSILHQIWRISVHRKWLFYGEEEEEEKKKNNTVKQDGQRERETGGMGNRKTELLNICVVPNTK